MLLYDQHVHSRHSGDSDIDPRAAVIRALDRGLAGVTFTEHYDTHPEDWPTCCYDHQAYNADIAALRDEFGDDIAIGKGIEICHQPEHLESILGLLTRGGFDAVLLSVHWTASGAIHDRRLWERKTAEEISRAYLTAVLEATETCVRLERQGGNPFNILGHLDLVRRYSRRFLDTDEPLGNADLVDAILRNCVTVGLVPEINTSSLRQGLTEPMPSAAVIRRYAELGGKAVALGSDAHTVEHVGAGLHQAAAMAWSYGIDRLAVFQNGCARTVPLAE